MSEHTPDYNNYVYVDDTGDFWVGNQGKYICYRKCASAHFHTDILPQDDWDTYKFTPIPMELLFTALGYLQEVCKE